MLPQSNETSSNIFLSDQTVERDAWIYDFFFTLNDSDDIYLWPSVLISSDLALCKNTQNVLVPSSQFFLM